MTMDRAFIVVLGADQKGIIAKISGMLFEHDANILDVQQKVMDGIFVMTLLADLKDCSMGAEELRHTLEAMGKQMGLTVMLQSEKVIKAMQRV
jgi:ACT domain-containing protein